MVGSSDPGTSLSPDEAMGNLGRMFTYANGSVRRSGCATSDII
jgi:hypothetical protein